MPRKLNFRNRYVHLTDLMSYWSSLSRWLDIGLITELCFCQIQLGKNQDTKFVASHLSLF